MPPPYTQVLQQDKKTNLMQRLYALCVIIITLLGMFTTLLPSTAVLWKEVLTACCARDKFSSGFEAHKTCQV